MVTIRQALLSVEGEDAHSILPIVAALSELGFIADAVAGGAFRLLNAERVAGLTVRQQLALQAAVLAAAAAAASAAGGTGGGGRTNVEAGERSGGEGVPSSYRAREKVVSGYFATDKQYRGVFTPLFPRVLVTHQHGSHASWQLGDHIEVLANDGTAGKQRCVQARVFGVHPTADVIFCSTTESLAAPVLDLGVTPAAPYLVLECSNHVKALSVSRGVITTTVTDGNGFIRGDTPSLPGAAGGGCFSAETGRLFAVHVSLDEKRGNRALLVPVGLLLGLMLQHSEAPIPEYDWGEGE